MPVKMGCNTGLRPPFSLLISPPFRRLSCWDKTGTSGKEKSPHISLKAKPKPGSACSGPYQEARYFEKFRNKNYHCTALRGKTPLQYVVSEDIYIRKLHHDVTLKKFDLSLKDGYIQLIRFIRSDCRLDVFGEKFKMPERVKYTITP